MSLLDRMTAAITPTASDEKRSEAREHIEACASNEPWLRMIVDQHKQIESLFTEAKSAKPRSAVLAAEDVARLLTGHATAEEAVLYPEIADHGGKAHAGMGYEEHAMTKVQLAKLRDLDPSGKEWREKLEHVESAIQQHVYQEEHSWLPELLEKLPAERKELLASRYREHFERYCGPDRIAGDTEVFQ